MLPAVETNTAAVHFLLGFHTRNVSNVTAAITQGNLGWFLCLCGTARSSRQVIFAYRSYLGPESAPAFLGIRAVEAQSEVHSCLETLFPSKREIANVKDYMDAVN